MSRRVSQVEPVATGVGFVEGPVVTQAGEIVFVSIDQGLIYRLPESGALEVLAVAPAGPNGAVEAADGRIYVTQNGGVWPGTPVPGVPAGVQVIEDGRVQDIGHPDMLAP